VGFHWSGLDPDAHNAGIFLEFFADKVLAGVGCNKVRRS
jgi:hypothetical protein